MDGLDKKHRSSIVVLDRFTGEKGKQYIEFFLANDERATKLFASQQYVVITAEGDPGAFFDPKSTPTAKFVEPDIPWVDSEARQILYNALIEGTIPLDPDPQFTTRDIHLCQGMNFGACGCCR